jgi:2-dehydro-3-deoxyphosphooctonate aldolase (KDO 8-P synthase)
MSSLQPILSSTKANPFWICGPCIVESKEVMTEIALKIKTISEKYNIPFVFKASFDKANRTSHESYRGQGIEEGLRALEYIKKEFELPVVTDIHESYQAKLAAEVVDILQIPAFLCRQSDLLKAAAETNLPLNVKKEMV